MIDFNIVCLRQQIESNWSFGVSSIRKPGGTGKLVNQDGTRNKGYSLWDGGYYIVMRISVYTGSHDPGMRKNKFTCPKSS